MDDSKNSGSGLPEFQTATERLWFSEVSRIATPGARSAALDKVEQAFSAAELTLGGVAKFEAMRDDQGRMGYLIDISVFVPIG